MTPPVASPASPTGGSGIGSGRRRELLIRIVSAAILGPMALAAAWHGFPWFDLVVALAAVLAVAEWKRMVGGWTHPAWLAVGLLYILLAMVAFLSLRHDAAHGQRTILWLLAVVWAIDTFAYVFGRRFGGPKLAPLVSPSKTWSGLGGGMLAAALASAGFGWWFGTSIVGLAIDGALVALLSQAGDLAESAAKRRFGVKDSGRIIPGHGGILDRIDGLMGAALFVAAVRLVEKGAFPWP